MNRKSYFVGCLVVLGLFGLGCGSQSGPKRLAVSGTVKHPNLPVINGAITLVPDGGQAGPASNGPITDGKFRISAAEGPVAGPHKAHVNLVPAKKGAQPPSSGTMSSQPPKMHWELKVVIDKDNPVLNLVLDDK